MRADTQFSVVEATLKGYQKWIIAHGRSPQEDVRMSCLFRVQALVRLTGQLGAAAERARTDH